MEYKYTEQSLFKQITSLLFILLFGAFVVNGISSSLGNFLYYTLIVVMYLRSKNYIFWNVVFFIMLMNPWGLFYYVPYEWYFKLSSNVGLSYVTIFAIVIFIKYMFFGKVALKVDIFKKFYPPILYFIIFFVFWGFYWDYDLVAIFKLFKVLPAFLLFAVIPKLFSHKDLDYFNKIIFSFSIIHAAGTFIEIITKGAFMNVLFFGKDIIGVAVGDELIRFVGGITIHLYVMIIGLYYVINKNQKVFKDYYLWFIILLSWVVILSSATRGWMISSTILIMGFLFFTFFQARLSSRSIMIVSLFIIIGLIILPSSYKRNLDLAFARLETIDEIGEGNMDAGGPRLTTRIPAVMEIYSQSPILGFGYSKITATSFDEHVGNHSLLLFGGYFSLLIIWLTVIALTVFFFMKEMNQPGRGYIVFSLALIIIMAIHSTSRSMVSFYMPVDIAFLIGLIFNHFNASYSKVSITKIYKKNV